MMHRQSKRWKLREPISEVCAQELAEFPPFFRQVLSARGVSSLIDAYRYLDATVDSDNPLALKGMSESIDRLVFAIKHQEKIVVYGDYDVDGVTATALMVQLIERLGGQVSPYIPNRFDEGYGLNSDAVETLAGQGVQLLLTVDCGIRSPLEAERAAQLGLDLIISDHHQPGEALPEAAYAIICQHQPGDDYPDKYLSGVGLAYKIAQALVKRFPEQGVQAEDWLDLVALGTVSDVVPLKGENRSLVRRGLNLMRQARRPGIVSLANVARINLFQVAAGDIGFMLGPRLNAAGRLESARDALDLLLCGDSAAAAPLAQRLDNRNRERQDLTRKMQEEAMLMAQQEGAADIVFAFDPDFNEGVVGLSAARLVEAYYRPAIVGRIGPETTRASCRSIPEFHITRALDTCRDLLIRHGGHAVAAGFTVRTDDLPELKKRLAEIARVELSGRDLCPVLWADQEIPLHKLRPEHVASLFTRLEQLQPTGQENPEAVFISRKLRVLNPRLVGNEGQHLKLRLVTESNTTYDAIAFRQGHMRDSLGEQVDLMYVFERNEYNGQVSLQLNVRDLKPSGQPD